MFTTYHKVALHMCWLALKILCHLILNLMLVMRALVKLETADKQGGFRLLLTREY